MRDAYAEGYQAFLEGKPKSANPYGDASRNATDWRVGWKTAQMLANERKAA